VNDAAAAEEAAAPTTVTTVALGLGLAAAYVLPNGLPGLGLVLLGLAAAVALRFLHEGRLGRWQAAHAVTALLLLSCAAWRDAPWVVALDVMAALALGSLAIAPARTWAGLARSAVLSPAAGAVSAGWLSRGVQRLARRRNPSSHTLRGLVLTALLVTVFLPLLISADQHFADLVDSITPTLPDLGTFPARAIVFAVATCGVAGGIRVMQRPLAEPVVPPARHTLTRTVEWALPLTVLVVLLASFVITQLAEVAQGREHVLSTAGLSYADYARAGFAQLLAVTALVIVCVAASVRWAPRTARPWLAALCLLALAIDASALLRLHLYADAYGLTRLRIAASTLALWLGVVIVLTLVAASRKASWLPNAVALSAAIGLLALTAYNPDARIARTQLARTTAPDLSYLSSLSADAADELAKLPPADASCLLVAQRDRGHSWTEANLARAHAADTARRVLRVAPATSCPTYTFSD
jgi:hypothetical protein